MCILKEVKRFIVNGALTFREASQGRYKQKSEAISAMREELFNDEEQTGFATDRKNLLRDKQKIQGDIRKSFNNYVLNHG